MEKKVKIAILGYGHIGKKHAEMVAQNQDYELVALIDPKFSMEVLINKNPVFHFQQLEDFLKSNISADIVAVCTPNGLHFNQAKILINAGINVIVEKPIALKSDEAIELEQLALEKELHIFPVMQNRFSPPAIWLKSLMESKVLGNIFIVQISCFWNRNDQYYTKESWRGTKDLDGGTLFTQFSHYLDIMYWLFGEITNIKSKFADFNHADLTEFEDSGIITFDFDSGGMGSFTFSTSVWNENLESSLTIIAENGSIKVGGQYMNHVEKCIIKDYISPQLPETNLANDYGSFKGSAQNHQYLYQNIIDFLRDGKKVHTTTDNSAHVLRIIENIYAQKN
ncbi:Gfo/Idh/MocA family protein [Chryseobacterium sp. MP_3.2]|uniref:Gfo/Idh/MocA family protein n=1 Tax=Chryseobacterium sp. MP_3.2 TaxID=3071712 RepID=UPI002DFD7E5E|nr:UDP-N-acetyl-2-amino-2-deoxyglucuronate dehydrogenase [Chryseobacterium sp. MP_3.2]